jgi:LysR family pca operon transcriptional activator
MREMLLDSDAVAIMPGLLMVGDLLRGTLVRMALPVPAQPRPAGLILRTGHPRPAAADAFIGVLRGYVATIGERGLT